MRTKSSVPRLWFHLMAFVVPTAQLTFVFGVVTVTVGAASVKGTSLTSPSVGSLEGLIRINPWVVTVAGIGPGEAPVGGALLATATASGTHVVPLSGLKSMSTSPPTPRLWDH